MTNAKIERETAALGATGFLLPPVLDTETIRRALGLKSRSAVRRLHYREGLPLARVGRRHVCTRQAFQKWLDSRASEDTRTVPERPPGSPNARNPYGLAFRRGGRRPT